MKQSAGILLYRNPKSDPEFFLVHPGGPLWKKKDEGAWSIPKGEFEDEDPLEAALREFKEETGFAISGRHIALTPVKLKSGKKVFAFAIESDIEPGEIVSNEFEMEWPPRSGKKLSFPEIDKAGWFTAKDAALKLNVAQAAFIDELLTIIRSE